MPSLRHPEYDGSQAWPGGVVGPPRAEEGSAPAGPGVEPIEVETVLLVVVDTVVVLSSPPGAATDEVVVPPALVLTGCLSLPPSAAMSAMRIDRKSTRL